MVTQKASAAVVPDTGTKERIMEAAITLFAVKGFDGASIREIAKLADVNVASLNYHFKSKENLRQELVDYLITEFKNKILNLPEVKTAAEYSVKIYQAVTADSAKCLNQFKMILESEDNSCATEPYPIGYEQFSLYLSRELGEKVPQAEKLWLVNVVFSYIIHISVMSSTSVGKKSIEKFFPRKKDSIPIYITQLVETLIRDLNHRYPG
ncbi:MAG TPA: TetR family transcriptional regulator [Bacteriovoracaceae bacterium]|nr:TetR family transcriptional regulator [Bacteriovoracaceae bacterium]